MLLSGISVAKNILEKIRLTIVSEKLVPGLGVVLVGDDAPSHLYVGIKEKRAKSLGIFFVKEVFSSKVSEEEIIEAIEKLNKREDIHGIIVQLPLPSHLDTDKIISSIEPKKDTDGFHPETIRKFLAGDKERLPVFPRAMLELVQSAPEERKRNKGIVIVNSSLMGDVLQKALEDIAIEVTQIIKQDQVGQLLPTADIILTATGEAHSLSTFDCKKGAVIVDGGISYDEEGKVIGDVARDDGVYREDIWVTPVPGGVGPVTVAVLLARVTEAALRAKKSD